MIKKGKSGYLIGQLKKMPAVFDQGLTVEEVKENIVDSLELYHEDQESHITETKVYLESELDEIQSKRANFLSLNETEQRLGNRIKKHLNNL